MSDHNSMSRLLTFSLWTKKWLNPRRAQQRKLIHRLTSKIWTRSTFPYFTIRTLLPFSNTKTLSGVNNFPIMYLKFSTLSTGRSPKCLGQFCQTDPSKNTKSECCSSEGKLTQKTITCLFWKELHNGWPDGLNGQVTVTGRTLPCLTRCQSQELAG